MTDLLIDRPGRTGRRLERHRRLVPGEFLALPADEALTKIITGAGELSRGELAGERMNVAYEERSQEDEHSCFSDNTTNDLVANATAVADGAERRLPEREADRRVSSTSCAPRMPTWPIN